MKTITLTCECGCGEKSIGEHSHKGWLVLTQIPPNSLKSDPKIRGELHFKNFICLEKWTQKAIKAIPGLQKTADGLRPRGDLINEDCKGLYI